jgi:hypothetical protein
MSEKDIIKVSECSSQDLNVGDMNSLPLFLLRRSSFMKLLFTFRKYADQTERVIANTNMKMI